MIAWHGLFWACCAWLRLPFSYCDDSLIVGPAIALVDGHGLRNIYLSREFYSAGTYLFYPPTFFWVLAGWIVVFGRGVASLSMFWAACGLGISLSVGALLARVGRSAVGHVAAPAMVLGCIAYTGYRYEILALASLTSGVALGLAGRRLAGYTLLCLTPTIAPTLLAASLVAIAGLLHREPAERWRREAGLIAAAFGIALLWLCISVSGNIAGLIATMYRYRAVRIGVGGRVMEGGVLTFVLLTNMLTVAVSRCVLKRGWTDGLVRAPLLLVATWLLTLLTHARPTVLVALNVATLVLCALAMAAVAAERLPPGRRVSAAGHASGMALGGTGILLMWLNIGYAATIPLRSLSPAAIGQARAIAAQAAPGRTIVVDPRVLRDALHYPSRRRIEDSMVRHRWPDIYPDLHHLPQNELWIVSRAPLVASAGPPVRGILDMLFISPGLAAVPRDGICRIDAAVARRWHGNDIADLAALACV